MAETDDYESELEISEVEDADFGSGASSVFESENDDDLSLYEDDESQVSSELNSDIDEEAIDTMKSLLSSSLYIPLPEYKEPVQPKANKAVRAKGKANAEPKINVVPQMTPPQPPALTSASTGSVAKRRSAKISVLPSEAPKPTPPALSIPLTREPVPPPLSGRSSTPAVSASRLPVGVPSLPKGRTNLKIMKETPYAEEKETIVPAGPMPPSLAPLAGLQKKSDSYLELLTRDPTESDSNFAIRSYITTTLANSVQSDLSPQMIISTGRLIANQDIYGVQYEEKVEEILKYLIEGNPELKSYLESKKQFKSYVES